MQPCSLLQWLMALCTQLSLLGYSEHCILPLSNELQCKACPWGEVTHTRTNCLLLLSPCAKPLAYRRWFNKHSCTHSLESTQKPFSVLRLCINAMLCGCLSRCLSRLLLSKDLALCLQEGQGRLNSTTESSYRDCKRANLADPANI